MALAELDKKENVVIEVKQPQEVVIVHDEKKEVEPYLAEWVDYTFPTDPYLGAPDMGL